MCEGGRKPYQSAHTVLGRCAASTGRAIMPLLNSACSGAKLLESDQAGMDAFLEKVLQLLPLLSLGNSVEVFNVIDNSSSQKVDLLTCSIKGLIATGKRTANGFVVFKGSQAVKEYRASAANWITKRDMHLANGLLVDQGEHYIFAHDYEFSSPSAAGAIVRGGSTNGLTSWKNQAGVSLKNLA